jgi:hypothetical protein
MGIVPALARDSDVANDVASDTPQLFEQLCTLYSTVACVPVAYWDTATAKMQACFGYQVTHFSVTAYALSAAA